MSVSQELQGVELLRKLIDLLVKIFNQDVKFRIIVTLAKREGVTLRELARNVGISPKTLYKYLSELCDKGIVSVIEASPRIKVYTLSREYEWLRSLFKDIELK